MSQQSVKITRVDAGAIRGVGRCLRAWERSGLTDEELVYELFRRVLHCETPAGIEQCVALMPPSLAPVIEQQIAEISAQTHPGEWFVSAPHQPTAAELEQLDQRVREIFASILHALAHPVAVVEYPIDDPDGLRQNWFVFRFLETVPGEKYRHAECQAARVALGVFCPAHHFEMVYGQPVPTEPADGHD